MKRLLVLLTLLVSICGFSGTAQSDITSTQVSAGMEIDYLNQSTIDAVQTSNGATSASVNFFGPNTGAQVSSSLNLSPLGAETVKINFDIGMHGNGYGIWPNPGYPDSGYLGAANYSGNANEAVIDYNAVSASTPVTITWDFTYSGAYNWPLSKFIVFDPNYKDPNAIILPLGGGGITTIHYTGDQTFNLSQGSHEIDIKFFPNVGGSIGQVDGELLGYVSFDFGSQPQSVPEPTTMLLLGLGLVGLAGIRRKFKE